MDLTKLTDPASFADTPPEGFVRREGFLFRLGTYHFPVEKGGDFTLTEQEADRAIATFRPVTGNLEHTPTVLSGEVGVLRNIWRKGDEVWGHADVPNWLHGLLDRSKSRISCEWDRKAKTLAGWGWTLDPRIEGAALFSAYAAFKAEQGAETPQAQPATQGAGARLTPRQKREKIYMPLLDSIKKALTAGTPQPQAASTADFSQAGAGETKQGVNLTPEQMAQLLDVLKGQSKAAEDTGKGEGAEDKGKPLASFAAPGPESGDAEPMDEATADFRANQIVTRAGEFADRAIAEGVQYPAMREALVAFFTGLGLDNEQNGPSRVTFSKSDGKVINDRVAMAMEIIMGGPKHAMFSQGLPVNVLNSTGDPASKKSAADLGREQAAAFNAEAFGPIVRNLPEGTVLLPASK